VTDESRGAAVHRLDVRLRAREPRQNEVSNNRCAQLDCADAETASQSKALSRRRSILPVGYLAYRMIGTADNQL